jgi:hypothetical protein
MTRLLGRVAGIFGRLDKVRMDDACWDQPQRWHQALIGENTDRRLLGVVEFDTCW